MQFGYFDNENLEYVITRPDTPGPWANYLGSPEYGALISNHAGGYSFAKSGANGRILRYVFNRFDEPGRYIYLRDNADGDYWSASWQPVGKDTESYKSVCRHGTGYTVFDADYKGIHSEAVYYVPDGMSYEVWMLRVRNDSDVERELTITGSCEFTNHGNYEQDQVNLQYSMFITRTLFAENRIRQQINGNLEGYQGDVAVSDKGVTERFFGLAGAEVSSCCGERDAFLGNYHTYRNPVGVITGDLGGRMAYNGNCVGALSTVLGLKHGESKTVAFILGEKGPEESAQIMKNYASPEESCGKEVEVLKAMWRERFSHFKVKTPCAEFDTMINTWNAYNCFMTFTWSRAASFFYCGLRNGYGYRDTVQDIQGVIHLSPEEAADKIRFMLSAQVHHGGGLPLVKFNHNAGHEDTPEDDSYVRATGHPAYRADDALWLFPTVYKYISETGNIAFLDEVIPFANRDEGSVYEHLKRALDFSLNHLGPHGMPAGLYADWNDCLRLGKNGESAFVAFQFYYAFTILREFAAEKNDTDYLQFLEEKQEALGRKLIELCWDGDRFIRGYTEDGGTIGKGTDPEANMWLNPQSWGVISGLADPEKARLSMDNVYERLNTEYGAVLMDPPYHLHAFDGALAVIFNAGVKENGGVFSQSQGWLILAEALMGRGNRAFTYFCETAPSMQNDRAEIRVIEPYCYGQFTEGKASPHAGRSHVHWLTGTASTVMVGCVEGILGMRPDLHGIKIAPSIPADWKGLEIEKDFRGRKLHITIENPDGKESGFTSMTVNGKPCEDNYVPESLLTENTEIVLTM